MSPRDRACALVYDYTKRSLEGTDKHATFALDEVEIVWFSYVMGNWKAMVITTLPDNMYYEVTHNAAKAETYVDAYMKFDNVSVPD